MRTLFVDTKLGWTLEEIDLHPTPLPHRTAPAPHRAPTCTSCGGYLQNNNNNPDTCYFCEEE